MLNNPRALLVAFSLCFALAAGAQSKVTFGADGKIQITKGGKKVEVGGGKVSIEKGEKKVDVGDGKVNAQKGDKSIEVQTDDEDDGDEASTAGSGKGSGSGGSSDSTIVVNGEGSNRNLRCVPKGRVQINGSGHEFTVTGDCEVVEVNGTGNTVKVEAAGHLKVTGVSNSITWKRGVGAAKPKVSQSGINNSVSQEK